MGYGMLGVPYRVRTTNVQLSDTTMPLLQVRFNGGDDTHTIAFDNNGGGSTDALLVSLVDDSGTTTFDVDGADETAATIGALVDGINAVSGWDARRFNAPADYSTNSNDFIDLAATSVSHNWTNLLYKDASEVLVSAARIGTPTCEDRNGVQLLRIEGYADVGAASTIRISEDPKTSDATAEVLLLQKAITDAAETEYYDWSQDTSVAPVFRGPVLVEVVGASSLATDLSIRVMWRQADI